MQTVMALPLPVANFTLSLCTVVARHMVTVDPRINMIFRIYHLILA
jgi:hypothetical protein